MILSLIPSGPPTMVSSIVMSSHSRHPHFVYPTPPSTASTVGSSGKAAVNASNRSTPPLIPDLSSTSCTSDVRSSNFQPYIINLDQVLSWFYVLVRHCSVGAIYGAHIRFNDTFLDIGEYCIIRTPRAYDRHSINKLAL